MATALLAVLDRSVPFGATAAWSGAAPLYLLCALAGVAAGFLSGLLGIGGSLVVVPALYLLLPGFGVDRQEVPHVAIATALAVMLPSALCASAVQQRQRRLHLAWLTRLAPGAIAGAVGGAMVALHVNGTLLALAFAAQSVYYGYGLLRRAAQPSGSWRARFAARIAGLPALAVGPVTGGFCACIGMGAGSLIVPYLVLKGVDMLRATATSGAVNLCIALGGVLGLALAGAAPVTQAGMICWPAALVTGLAATAAVPLGVLTAPRLGAASFCRVLGIVNLLGAAVLLWRTFSL